jgi:hypothetical protein
MSFSAPPPRSWLFVPADSNKKMMKALESGADAVIFDLEDSVAPAQKLIARELLTLLPSDATADPNAGSGSTRLEPISIATISTCWRISTSMAWFCPRQKAVTTSPT